MRRPITDPLRAALHYGTVGVTHRMTCGELGIALEIAGRPDLAAQLDRLMTRADETLQRFAESRRLAA